MKAKLLLSVILTFSFFTVFSQVPQGFNYQAIARDASGNPILNQTFLVKMSILSDTNGFKAGGTGVYLWEEQHSVKTNGIGLFSLVIGTQARLQGSATAFNLIDWNAGQRFVGIKIQYPAPTWKNMGTAKLNSVPYAMVADKANGVNAGSKLSVTSANDLGTEALFEVKRKDGQTVFAVYPDAVNIYVPRSTVKGAKGGFAIGGFDGSKLGPQDYFRVTPDSVRIYIDPTPAAAKGSKGGFAIGGYGEAKGGINSMYFNLTGASAVNTVVESPQILWYPIKKAFLAGSVHIGAVDSVGQNSTALGYRSIAMGDFSQAFGYKAKAYGNYSTSIGKNSVAGSKSAPLADNSFAFGNAAKALGNDSYALGSGAIASGYRSFAFGSVGLDDSGNPTTTPTTASQSYTVAIGMGAQATQLGGMALGIGALASGYYSNSFGYYSTSSGYYSSAIGYKSTASNYYAGAFGFNARAEGQGALALGYSSWAVNNFSTAIGVSAKTTADYASAFGRSALAQGISSVAVGYSATTGTSAVDASAFGKLANASGISSMAVGVSAKATANTSTAIGYNSEANGDYSFAIGTYGLNADGTVNTARPTKTTLSYSVALGMGAQASKKGDMAFGVNSTASGEYSTALGYGPTSSGQYSTSIGYSATSAGIGSIASGYSASSSANYSAAMGYGAIAAGTYATGIGFYSKANGNKSLAIGSQYSYTYYRFVYNRLTGTYTMMPYTVNKYNVADGDFSVAVGNGNQSTDGGITLGSNNTALASGAVAIGHTNTANSMNSFAGGSNNITTGYNAIAMGENLNAYSANSFVVGSYNTLSGSTTTWVETDPLFVVGNGEEGLLHDAVRVNKNGGTYINAENAYAGLWVTNNTTSANPNTSYGMGIMSGIQRNKAGLTYYSGYFYSSGSLGNYSGLYADVRSGGAVDVAEYIYDTQANTEAADVVVADKNNKESVIKSSMPYQNSVVGVVSTKPHLTMGMELVIDEKTGDPLPGAKPVARLALTGRVPVKVTGENGAIVPGDYLTTSSTPGHAMKWTLLDVNAAKDFNELKSILSENERRRNAIIGKALESHSAGTGKIVVLISLQ
jgi:hypothetical protein